MARYQKFQSYYTVPTPEVLVVPQAAEVVEAAETLTTTKAPLTAYQCLWTRMRTS